MIEIIILVLVIANLIIELAILLKLRGYRGFRGETPMGNAPIKLQDKYAADLDFLVEVPPPKQREEK